MPINQNREDPIPNHYEPNQNQRNKSHDVIAKLIYSDLFRDGAGTLHANDLMRVDMQGYFFRDGIKHYNIQVQVNQKGGKSTVAHANVSETISSDNPGNQQGAVNAVISALNKSLDSGDSYLVDGSNP